MDVTFYMFFSSFLMSMSAWCVFLWAVRTGQFRDVEESKSLNSLKITSRNSIAALTTNP